MRPRGFKFMHSNSCHRKNRNQGTGYRVGTFITHQRLTIKPAEKYVEEIFIMFKVPDLKKFFSPEFEVT